MTALKQIGFARLGQVAHRHHRNDRLVVVGHRLLSGFYPGIQFAAKRPDGFFVIVTQLCNVPGLQHIRTKVGQDILRQTGAAQLEIKSCRAAVVDDLEQQMVFALSQLQVGLLLVRRRAAVHILGEHLTAVEEHLDRVVTAKRHGHLLHH